MSREAHLLTPPDLLNGAQVILWASLDGAHPTGFCTHRGVDGNRRPAVLAICVYPDHSPGYYLFSCDSSWHVLTDTWHETLELAKQQAEAEYTGVTAFWQKPLGTISSRVNS